MESIVVCRYLKVEQSSLRSVGIVYDCQISIPNQENFSSFFEKWFSIQFSEECQYISFLNHLVLGDGPNFVQDLRDYLLKSASMFDTKGPRKSDGLVLAILASLSATHYVKSNREEQM